MFIFQFRELGEYLHHLVSTLAACCHDDDIGVGLLSQGMLKHCLAASERSRDEARAAFRDRIQSVYTTDTCLHHLERTRFLDVAVDCHLHRPFLRHRDVDVFAVGVGQDGDGVVDLILTGLSHFFHGVSAFKRERHHDFVRQPAFFDLTQPVGGYDLVASLRYRREVPKFLFIQGLGVFTTFQKHAFHCGEVVLQAIEITRKQAWTECHFKHIALKLHRATDCQSAGALEHLHGGLVAVHLDDLCHQLDSAKVDEADLILCHRAVHLDGDQVCNDSCNFSCCHIIWYFYFLFPPRSRFA